MPSRSDIPCARGASVRIALFLIVQAAIIPIETAIGLHPAPEIKRPILFVSLHDELDIVIRLHRTGEIAASHQWRVHCEVTTNGSLTSLLLYRESHAGDDICGGVIQRAIVVSSYVWIRNRSRGRRKGWTWGRGCCRMWRRLHCRELCRHDDGQRCWCSFWMCRGSNSCRGMCEQSSRRNCHSNGISGL